MPELRKDPIVQRWVIMAPERADRPIEVIDEPLSGAASTDPFAEGNESRTTPEILAYRAAGTKPDEPGWRVRVVPNKYPSVVAGDELNPRNIGLYECANGIGAHEVIIECPHFETNLGRLSPENIAEVLQAYHERLNALSDNPTLAYGLIFKNQGATAGASVLHTHSQLLATPFVPVSITDEIKGALDYYQRTGRNIFGDIIRQEIDQDARIAFESPRFIAICPYASRFAYETWILPRNCGSHFERADPGILAELAIVLKTVLSSLENLLDNPAFNFMIHSGPFRVPDLPHYTWHIEILPRITRVAGYEWGSGYFVNQVLPEQAAKRFRSFMIG